jgi:hypothetical protein
MRTLRAGLAVALVGSVLLAPLNANARRQDGIISGSAVAEAKQPYSQYIMRARDVSNNEIVQKTSLDANAEFALNGLAPGAFMIELVKGALPDGQGGKVVCSAGPFTLLDSTAQVNDLMIKKGANVQCNRPVAAWYLLGAAAAAGVTAGIVSGGGIVTPPPVSVTPNVVSGAQ